MLEARIETLHSYGQSEGVVQIQGVNVKKIQDLAKDGWQLTTIITPRPSPEVILGVFYRKVHTAEKASDAPAAPDTPKKPGRPKKSDA